MQNIYTEPILTLLLYIYTYCGGREPIFNLIRPLINGEAWSVRNNAQLECMRMNADYNLPSICGLYSMCGVGNEYIYYTKWLSVCIASDSEWQHIICALATMKCNIFRNASVMSDTHTPYTAPLWLNAPLLIGGWWAWLTLTRAAPDPCRIIFDAPAWYYRAKFCINKKPTTCVQTSTLYSIWQERALKSVKGALFVLRMNIYR